MQCNKYRDSKQNLNYIKEILLASVPKKGRIHMCLCFIYDSFFLYTSSGCRHHLIGN